MPALLMLFAAHLGRAALMPGADEKWRHFQSGHFEVYSRNSESETRLLLHNLELVHAIFFESFGFTATRSVPVTVYFFSRDKFFEAYKPEAYRKTENIATFYHGDLDRGILTVAPLPSYDAAQQLAFGSYTFHLFRLMGDPAPPWYLYGLSGIFRNLVLNSETFEFGRSETDQITRLQRATLIPVEVMFGADEQSNAFMANQDDGLFHDESWAMVHYLLFGQNKMSRAKVLEFVDYAMRHSRSFDAAANRRVFEEKTGLTYRQMDNALENYFSGGRYSWTKRPLPAIAPSKSYAMRKVPLDEIDLRLAELGLRVNRAPMAKLALLQAAGRPAEAARIQEVLGTDAARAGDWDVAVERWERALAAGSDNPAVLHELCQVESRKRFQRFDLYYRLPDDAAVKLRDLLRRAITAMPLQTSTYELLAWVEATAREPQIANVNLVQKNFPRLKEQNRTLLALALVRLRLDDKAGAAEMLNLIALGQPDNWVKYGAELTRAQLEDRPVNPDNLPAVSSQPASRAPVIRLQIPKPRI
ncbi:MAG: hypothetical protein JWQ62_1773 [Lacunisphaera sp.]|nr:hypothetical protein [Lacunisphaera sp.]